MGLASSPVFVGFQWVSPFSWNFMTHAALATLYGPSVQIVSHEHS
jgi:hypothetical protein